MIYSIYKVTNKITDKVYIGFTCDLTRRISEHKRKYSKINYIFYHSIRKHGWENFIWETIYQSKDKDHALMMEQHFIEHHRSYVGFDDCVGYNTSLGGEGNYGEKKNSKKKEFAFKHDGNIVTGINLYKFCTENSLGYSSMKEVLRGERKSYKGYTNINDNFIPRAERIYKLYNTLTNEVETFSNIAQFSIDNNLNRTRVTCLLQGKAKSHRHYLSINTFI
jgi:predicted GIY-YIG superfamily endonuclease